MSIQDALLGSDSLSGIDFLLSLLEESASGRDISPRVPEVVQAACIRGAQNIQVKRLAYDLCKGASLTDYDCQLLVQGLKSDLSTSAPDISSAALRFLPHLPPSQLAALLEAGDIVPLMVKHLVGPGMDERAAAVVGLSRVLLNREALHACASSKRLVQLAGGYWQQLLDSLLDSEALVVAAATVAAAQLFEAAMLSVKGAAPEDLLLRSLAAHAARRIAMALGPVLEAAAGIPAPGQVQVMQMLLLLIEYLHLQPSNTSAGIGALQYVEDDGLTPSPCSITPLVGSYLLVHARSIDVGARTEACKALLRVADLSRVPNSAADGQALAGIPIVPVAWAATAVDSLLELKDCVLIESVLDDITATVASSLSSLPLPNRQGTLQQLWPLVARMRDVPQRTNAFALAWQAAVWSEAEARRIDSGAPPGGLLSIINDRYVSAVLAGKQLPRETHASTTTNASSLASAVTTVASQAASIATQKAQAAASTATVAAGSAATLATVAASNAAHGVSVSSKVSMDKLGGLWKSGIHKIAAIGGGGGGSSTVPAKEEQRFDTSVATFATTPIPPVAATAASAEMLPAPPPLSPGVSTAALAAPSYNGPATGGAASIIGTTFTAAGTAPPLSTVRHEMLAALLEVLNQQPEALAAQQLVQEVASAAAHDRPPAQRQLGERDALVVRWLELTSGVLQATAGCLAWEPPVTPQITTELSGPALKHASADFNTVPADSWLELLQLCCQASQAAKAVLHVQQRQPQATPQASDPSVAALGNQARALQGAVEQQQRELQQLVRQALSAWPALSRAVRPRVLWVAAHACELPPIMDASWELLLRCLADLLPKGASVAAAGRLSDFATSAASGHLYRAGRAVWGRDRPFLFDVIAASALCEAPEYEATGIAVSLSCIQRLASLLHNNLAVAKPAVAVQAQKDAAHVGGKLDGILKEFAATDLAGAWHAREWCKRLTRMLLSIVTFVPPREEAAALPPPAAAADPAGAERVRRVKTDFGDIVNSSSDEEDHEVAEPEPAMLKSAESVNLEAVAAANAQAVVDAFGDASEFRSRLASVGGASTQVPSYFAHTAAAHAAWGYPFGGPRSPVLFNSKRGRRHRAMQDNMQGAALLLRTAGRPHRLNDTSNGPANGPALSAGTAFRLDSPVFWSSLPGATSRPVELTGPGDPILLQGSCHQSCQDPGVVVVQLTATSRLDSELVNVELHIKTNGALLVERRGSVWQLPRLPARAMASHSFQAKLLGPGRTVVQCHIQLVPAMLHGEPVQLACLPLPVPAASALDRPREAPPVGAFLRQWPTLPVRAELSAVCAWPGIEGQMLVLSSLLRQPLACAMLQYLPGTAGFQAAFETRTSSNEVLAIMITTQMMPTPATVHGTLTLQAAAAAAATSQSEATVKAAAAAATAAGVAAATASSGRDADSYCQVYIRSSAPEAVQAVQANSAAWLREITAGTASLGLQHPGVPAGARPPIHPRVAALQQAYIQTHRAGTAGSGSGDAWLMDGGATTVVGSQVSQAWLRSAALSEWQRLAALA